MLGLKLNHVSKRGHWCIRSSYVFGRFKGVFRRNIYIYQPFHCISLKFCSGNASLSASLIEILPQGTRSGENIRGEFMILKNTAIIDISIRNIHHRNPCHWNCHPPSRLMYGSCISNRNQRFRQQMVNNMNYRVNWYICCTCHSLSQYDINHAWSCVPVYTSSNA